MTTILIAFSFLKDYQVKEEMHEITCNILISLWCMANFRNFCFALVHDFSFYSFCVTSRNRIKIDERYRETYLGTT